jgi:hypothetical protein
MKKAEGERATPKKITEHHVPYQLQGWVMYRNKGNLAVAIFKVNWVTGVASYRSGSTKCVWEYNKFDWWPWHIHPTAGSVNACTLKKATAMFVETSIILPILYAAKPQKPIKHTENYKQKYKNQNYIK